MNDDHVCPDCNGVLYEYREHIRTSIRGVSGEMDASEWICWGCGYYNSNSPGFFENADFHRSIAKDSILNKKMIETILMKAKRVYP